MNLKLKFNKAKRFLQDNAPEIMTYAGVAGIGVGVVTACMATPSAMEIIEEHKSRKEDIHEFFESDEYAEDRKNYNYTETCLNRDLAIEYFRFIAEMSVCYAIPAGILITSGGLIIGGQKQRKKRYLGVLAWAESLKKSQEKYRARVREKYGDEEDMYFMHGVRKEEIEVEEEDEKGKKKKVKKEIVVSDTDDPGLYTILFDETCLGWDPNPEIVFKQFDKYARRWTDLLRVEGSLFWNRILREISHPIKDEGQDVGWIYNPDNPYGDDYVEIRVLSYDPDAGIYHISFNIAGNIRRVWQDATAKADIKWHA